MATWVESLAFRHRSRACIVAQEKAVVGTCMMQPTYLYRQSRASHRQQAISSISMVLALRWRMFLGETARSNSAPLELTHWLVITGKAAHPLPGLYYCVITVPGATRTTRPCRNRQELFGTSIIIALHCPP